MRYLVALLGFLFSLLILACSPSRVPVDTTTSRNGTRLPAAAPLPGDSVILSFQQSAAPLFQLTGPLQPVSLNKQELRQVDSLLLLVQQAHHLTLQRHYRQYIVSDSAGQKLVWVNALCRSYENKEYWRKNIYQVKGGGACYWSVQLNLTTAQASCFRENAPK